MKFLKLILKAVKWLKNIFDLVKWILAIIVLITSLGWFKTCSNKNETVQNYITIAKNEIIQKETLSGNHAIEKTQWFIDKKQLKQNISKEQAKGSDYLNQIKKLTYYTKDLEIENKRLKSYNNTLIESSDSIRTELVFINCDEVKISPIEKEHISITFDQSGDCLDVFYKYNAEIATIVYREKDKDQFFLWRWINPNWVYNSVTTINDPNAIIQNNVNIDFDK